VTGWESRFAACSSIAWVGYQAPGRRVVRRLMNTRQVGVRMTEKRLLPQTVIDSQASDKSLGMLGRQRQNHVFSVI
jgi:hypothetical protein